MILRTLTAGDLPQIHRLETEMYLPELHVSDDAFLRLIDLYPAGAFGLFDEEVLCGYAFAVPQRAGAVLDLTSPLEALPASPDVYYIHDVAVGGTHRGRGLGRRLVEELLRRARASGFPGCELVSVQGSAPFWERFGFRRVAEFEYVPGAPATRMALDLGRV
jgi:ribosomal protein S18 acetylase RimI-like enzyme